jgi:predicted enzyme related to lactoylglutathione lyase
MVQSEQFGLRAQLPVDNLDEMLDQLKRSAVKILEGPESHENGKFAWIIDPDGNKVELWEPGT